MKLPAACCGELHCSPSLSDPRAGRLFVQKITEAVDQGKVRREDVESIIAALEKHQERRLGEIRALVNEVQKLQAEETYLGAIIGGGLLRTNPQVIFKAAWVYGRGCNRRLGSFSPVSI